MQSAAPEAGRGGIAAALFTAHPLCYGPTCIKAPAPIPPRPHTDTHPCYACALMVQ